jgi:antitoxin (DNA-binding transcriptional repressor) of toxin-antitoxin stability system
MKRKPVPRRRRPDKIINNLYEAKLNLSRLVERAAAGEEIVIAKNGRPMARLVALPPKPRRVPGGWEGKVWEAPDCWAPMSDEELRLWYEGDIEPSS